MGTDASASTACPGQNALSGNEIAPQDVSIGARLAAQFWSEFRPHFLAQILLFSTCQTDGLTLLVVYSPATVIPDSFRLIRRCYSSSVTCGFMLQSDMRHMRQWDARKAKVEWN